MKKYNISTNLIQVIKNLYNKASSAVLFNGAKGDWFRTTVGVWQGCLLSPTLFNIFLERIMAHVLEDHEGTVSIGGRTIANLRFADDIDGLAVEEEEVASLVERLDKASTAYGLEISAEKTKLITNNTSGINTDQSQWTEASDSHKLQVPGLSYKWWGFRIAQATAALTRLKPVCIDKNISLSSKIRLMHSPCHIHLPVCLWIMDPHSRAPKENTSHGNEVLPQDTTHLVQRPCYQRGSPCQDPAGNWTTWRSANDRKEMQTAVVWSCFPLIRCGQNHPARHSERGKKTRRTMEEVGMDRPGVRQVPVGSGRTGKNGEKWLQNHLWCPNDPRG